MDRSDFELNVTLHLPEQGKNTMAIIRFVPNLHKYRPPDVPVPLNGFDPDGPWQMVPYKGTRYFHLEVIGVSSWSVKSDNPSIATVSRVQQYGGVDQDQNNVYQVDGLHKGSTFLVARGPNKEQLGRIEIEVKLQRKLFIRFFLVSDNAGHKTTFTDADTKSWTEFINDKVFEPQINVRFQYLSTGNIKINEDLGDRIDFEAIGDMPFVRREGKAGRVWHEITDAGMYDAHVFNVFCVWDFINNSTIEGAENVAFVSSKFHITADEMEKSGVTYNMCMLKQKISERSYFKYVLAHEVGHYLNRLPFHTEKEELLMTPGTAGIVLLKGDARRMNP